MHNNQIYGILLRVTYGSAQKQLDTRMHVTAWNFSCEDYIMGSLFEQAPVTFVPVSGKSLGMSTMNIPLILNKLFNET